MSYSSKTLNSQSNTINPATSATKSIPNYKKYAKNVTLPVNDPSNRLKPSDLSRPVVDIVIDDYPLIVEFNNIKDNSCQATCTVDVDQPIFQPSPKVLIFEDYAPFAVHEKKIYFRNNDSVCF